MSKQSHGNTSEIPVTTASTPALQQTQKEKKDNLIGILVSEDGFSTGALSTARLSSYPLILCHIYDSILYQFIVNSPLQQLVPKLSVVEQKSKILLLYNGQLLQTHSSSL